jgi:hypothetical protein
MNFFEHTPFDLYATVFGNKMNTCSCLANLVFQEKCKKKEIGNEGKNNLRFCSNFFLEMFG